MAAMIAGTVALSLLLWIVWPSLDPGTLRDGLPRLGLITYGGFVQYFNSLDMGVYGGLLLNFSPWMRSWLIWSLTLGSTAALALGRIVWQKRSPGFAGAASLRRLGSGEPLLRTAITGTARCCARAAITPCCPRPAPARACSTSRKATPWSRSPLLATIP